MNAIYQELQKLPKADAHSHLHLGANRKAFLKKYGHLIPRIPKSYPGLQGMIRFIKNDMNKALQSKEDVIFLLQNAIETSISDNVIYLEASIDFSLYRFFDFSAEALVENTGSLIEKYKTVIDFRPDLGINKELDVEKIYTNISTCIESGIFKGIDLYGKEDSQSLKKFIPFYELARSNGLKTKVHIGEFSDYITINNAIDILNPSEIQHGIRAIDSQGTLQKITSNNIRLNICPQSNVALGAVKDYVNHPIRKLVDEGIKISINTDDFLLFDTSISKQYTMLVQQKILTLEEVKLINKKVLAESMET